MMKLSWVILIKNLQSGLEKINSVCMIYSDNPGIYIYYANIQWAFELQSCTIWKQPLDSKTENCAIKKWKIIPLNETIIAL